MSLTTFISRPNFAALLLFVAYAARFAAAAEPTLVDPIEMRPDPEMQRRITELIDSEFKNTRTQAELADTKTLYARAGHSSRFLEFALESRAKGWSNLTQLMYYKIHAPDGDHNMMANEMMVLMQLPHILDFMEAGVPYFRGDNSQQDHLISRWAFYGLPGLTSKDFSPNCGLAGYLQRVSQNSAGKLPREYMRYCYLSNPHVTMICMAKVYGDAAGEYKQLRIADHEVAGALLKVDANVWTWDEAERAATPELERLSHNEQWWVRAYVASVLNGNPKLAAADIRQRLSRDDERLVRELVTFVAKGSGTRR